jgi:hypothetical protein
MLTLVVLFMVFFSVGWTPLQALYPAEILSYENRAKGLALQGWGASASGLINTFGLPPALGAIGYIVYLIFAAWDLVGLAIIYLYVVETKQVSSRLSSTPSSMSSLIRALGFDNLVNRLRCLRPWLTSQLSLEQVDEIFEAKNPKQRSFELFREAQERAKFEKEQERLRVEGA